MLFDQLHTTIKKLAPLSEENERLFLSNATQLKLSKGDILLDEGQVCNYLYFVEHGLLRTYINQDGKENNVCFTFEGQFITDLKSLKTNGPSHYAIVTGEESIITLFPKDALLGFYSASNELNFLCRKILGTLILENHELIDLHKIPTPAERYQYLVKNKPQYIQRIPISQLSSYIGIARETLSRIRKTMPDFIL